MEGVEPCAPRELFGGAMTATLPARFLDVSNFREVPDNQEVFADGQRDESVIVELLEAKGDVPDERAAEFFLMDLAAEQEGGPFSQIDMRADLAPEDVPGVDPSTPKSMAVGTLAIAKARQGPESRNTVKCHLANLRLREMATDVLITVNEPLVISQHSQSAAVVGTGAVVPPALAGCLPAGDVLKLVLSTLAIRDWTLFGTKAC